MSVVLPTLDLERALLQEFDLIVACDEVGRGALAGPVTVGAAVIDGDGCRRVMPEGLRDSKLVPERRRAALAEAAGGWVCASALGWAAAGEIDEVGIIGALGLAARRALDALVHDGVDLSRAVVILDGNHDYITPAAGLGLGVGPAAPVRPVIKADRDCGSAAAASVLAKVARDELMRELDGRHPAYEWARNKGYASAAHRAAIAAHGLSEFHRQSWAIAAAPALF